MSNRGSASKRFSKLIRYFNFQQRTVIDPVTQEETIEEVPVLESVSLEASTDVTVSGQQIVTSANNSISTVSLTIDTAEVTYNHSDSSLHVNGNALAFKSDVGNTVSLTIDTAEVTYNHSDSSLHVNGNALAFKSDVGNNAFPPGTKMLFQQTSAPTGWTKDTTHNNKALRVVSGTAGSGGSVAFTTALASKTPSGTVSVSGSVTVNNTALNSTSLMPSHSHQMNRHEGGGGHSGGHHYYLGSGGYLPRSSVHSNGGNGNHNHGASFSGSGSFSGSAIDLRVLYVDLIIATKA